MYYFWIDIHYFKQSVVLVSVKLLHVRNIYYARKRLLALQEFEISLSGCVH